MKESDAMKLRCAGPCPSSTGIYSHTTFHDEHHQGRRFFITNEVYLCSGSQCMGWKWEFLYTNSELGRRYEGQSKKDGYCGLLERI